MGVKSCLQAVRLCSWLLLLFLLSRPYVWVEPAIDVDDVAVTVDIAIVEVVGESSLIAAPESLFAKSRGIDDSTRMMNDVDVVKEYRRTQESMDVMGSSDFTCVDRAHRCFAAAPARNCSCTFLFQELSRLEARFTLTEHHITTRQNRHRLNPYSLFLWSLQLGTLTRDSHSHRKSVSIPWLPEYMDQWCCDILTLCERVESG